MRLISKIIFSLFSNGLALFAASYFVSGFFLDKSLRGLLTVAVIFTLANFFIGPILKLILTPIIIITLGLGILIANAIILYAVDYFSNYITIDGFKPLIYATVIIAFVNLVIHISAKKAYRE